jgi:hypothetical protein
MPARVWCGQPQGVLHGWMRGVQLDKQLVCGLPHGCDHVCRAPVVAGVLGAFPSVTVSRLGVGTLLPLEGTAV